MDDTMNSSQHLNAKSIYYPPGGLLIWFLIILELFTFLGAILIFLHYRGNDMSEFANSQSQLNPIIGSINTIVLITSGYLIAIFVNKLKENNKAAASYMLIGMLLGFLFLLIKGFEFYEKLELNIGLEYSTFFTFYWLMTGFHYVHVLFGVGLLFYMYFAVKKKKYTAENMTDIEASATYWHMCDLIWILIFPILYLI